jgi:hypothetical protein
LPRPGGQRADRVPGLSPRRSLSAALLAAVVFGGSFALSEGRGDDRSGYQGPGRAATPLDRPATMRLRAAEAIPALRGRSVPRAVGASVPATPVQPAAPPPGDTAPSAPAPEAPPPQAVPAPPAAPAPVPAPPPPEPDPGPPDQTFDDSG